MLLRRSAWLSLQRIGTKPHLSKPYTSYRSAEAKASKTQDVSDLKFCREHLRTLLTYCREYLAYSSVPAIHPKPPARVAQAPSCSSLCGGQRPLLRKRPVRSAYPPEICTVRARATKRIQRQNPGSGFRKVSYSNILNVNSG